MISLLVITLIPAWAFSSSESPPGYGVYPTGLNLRGTMVLAKLNGPGRVGRYEASYSLYAVDFESGSIKGSRIYITPSFVPFGFDVKNDKVFLEGYKGPVYRRVGLINVYDLREKTSSIPYELEGVLTSVEFSPNTGTLILSLDDYEENGNGRSPLTHIYECAVNAQRREEKAAFRDSVTIAGYAKGARVVLLRDNSYILSGSRDPSQETRTWLWLFNLNSTHLEGLPVGRSEISIDVGSFAISDDGKTVFLKSQEDKNIGRGFPFRIEERASVKIYFLEARNFVDSARFTDKFVVSPYNDFVFVPLTKTIRDPKGQTYPIRVLMIDLKKNRVVYSFDTTIVGRYWTLIGWYK